MRGTKYHYKRAIIGPPVKHNLNGVSLACRWWPYIEWWLGSFVIFRGSGPVLLRKPIFCDFSGGGGGGSGPPVPPLDPRMIFFRLMQISYQTFIWNHSDLDNCYHAWLASTRLLQTHGYMIELKHLGHLYILFWREWRLGLRTLVGVSQGGTQFFSV